MLGRFVPIGVRDPDFELAGAPASAAPAVSLARYAVPAAVGLGIGASLLVAALDAMQAMRGTPGATFEFAAALRRLYPVDVNGWLQVVGIVAFAAVGGMFVAATRAGRAQE